MLSKIYKESVMSYDHYKVWGIEISLENINSSEEFSSYLIYFISSVAKQAFDPKEYKFIMLDVVLYNGETKFEANYAYPMENDMSQFCVVFEKFKYGSTNNLLLKVRYVEEDLIDEENWPFN